MCKLKKIFNFLICVIFVMAGSVSANVFEQEVNFGLNTIIASHSASDGDDSSPKTQICWSPRISLCVPPIRKQHNYYK